MLARIKGGEHSSDGQLAAIDCPNLSEYASRHSMSAPLPQLQAHRERSGLIRGLGLWPATAIVIGDTIGTGVFLVSSDMA
jgi:hypothetical protein